MTWQWVLKHNSTCRAIRIQQRHCLQRAASIADQIEPHGVRVVDGAAGGALWIGDLRILVDAVVTTGCAIPFCVPAHMSIEQRGNNVRTILPGIEVLIPAGVEHMSGDNRSWIPAGSVEDDTGLPSLNRARK